VECLRLASFDESPEVRKERADSGGPISTSSTKQAMYPFTIYHAAAKITPPHTLYTQSASERSGWYAAFNLAIATRKSQQDRKMVSLPQSLFLMHLTYERSCTQLESSMTAFSGYPHVASLLVGLTTPVVRSVPRDSVGCLDFVPLIISHGFLSVSGGELHRRRLCPRYLH